jgi:hypothetical protein
MPLDASDRIRRIQEITIFHGYAVMKQKTDPGANVSTCIGFHSTVNNYTSYASKYAIQEGRGYFSTCQGD